MSKRIKISSKKDSDGFQIPEVLRSEASVSGGNADNPNVDERGENSWPISDSNRGAFGKKYSKIQLQSRCKLYKTIKTALENPRQRHVITSSVFNQIQRGIIQENVTNSSFVFSLKEIIKLIFEGAGIPSIFTLVIRDWTSFPGVESNMNQVIVDLQDNNTNVIQYYPLRSRKQGDTAFLETFTDFFSELGEKLAVILEGNSEPEMLKLVVLGWLYVLSKTPLRPLRHSGCVALNGVLKGLSKSRNDIDEKISRFKNQMKNESPDSKSYKSLEEEVSSQVEMTKNIDLLISKILNDFWTPRSQDISEDVRYNCFETLSKGILVFPSLFEAVSNTEIHRVLSDFLPEETNHLNKILILECISSILKLETFKTISHDLFKNRILLECLKNEIIISSKAPESHKDLFAFGELSINILILALKNDFLEEEYIDEIVDLLWITSSPPSSCSKIGALLAEFIDSSLFDGGITHDKVESRELIDLLDNHIEGKKLRNSLDFQGLMTIEPSRVRSDLQTLLEFIHEFGKDYVILTHRCVNAFWTKAPCVRDTKFLVEMLVSTELSGQQLEPLDEEIRKTLLLVLHSNVTYIEDLLMFYIEEPNSNSRNEIIFGKYRSLIAISSIMEYIEPLILIHEKNLDNLTILLSTFSTIVSLYFKLIRTKNNSKVDEIIPSGISVLKQFPLKKLLQILNSHSDPRVIDGICMCFSPILNIDLNEIDSGDFNAVSSLFLQMDETYIKQVQDGISDLKKQLMSDFFVIGRDYLADTDNVLYSDIVEEPKGKKSRTVESKNSFSMKNKVAKDSTINTICKFRRMYGVIKYLTLENIYLDKEYNRNNYSPNKSKNINILSPEQGTGIPYLFEILIEVLERSGRIVQKSSDQILVYQTSQLFCTTLDILTTGYTHLVQDLLRSIDSTLNKHDDQVIFNESIIEIYKSIRHKFSCTLIETIRFNLKHDSLNDASNNYCFDYLNILSISSVMVMFGLQGIIENSVQENEEFHPIIELIEWKILDSDLSLIIKEYVYWTNPNRNNENENEVVSTVSSALIEGFNCLITSGSDKKQPHYLLYPSCRIFEPLDNIKDETFVTSSETLETYRKKIKEFIYNKFAPGCILSLLTIFSQYKLISQLFIPVIFKYLIDIEGVMVNNYYLDGIKYIIKRENEREKLFLSNKFLDSFLFNDPNNTIGIFSILLITIVLSCIEKNFERAKIVSKKLIPSFTSKIGWRKVEEIIKENSLDISKSIIESFRFALIGEIHLPIYRNVINRNEIIEKSIKTKDSIKAYIDLLTTQNAPGGGKTVLNLLSSDEINHILDEIKLLCDFGNESNNENVSSYYFINESFDAEIKQFLDTIASFSDKDQQKKNNYIQKNKNTTNVASSNHNTSNVISSKNKKNKSKQKKNSLKNLDIYSDDDFEDDLGEDDFEFDDENHLNDENINIGNNNKIDDLKSISSSSHIEETVDTK
ncbi:hypothetical protein FG386_000380 [Cryptosporidium ryanae]|uniref:uncharacterized protein n=1 Tax=Cryptosporidium ryanae TaxID=515981 RepID=UPI003519F166|nr:hypothetical protein FG386_000380 [Cryptosporidium ryanae]